MARVVRVNCDKQKRFCRSKVGNRELPIMMVFTSGKKKRAINLGSIVSNPSRLTAKILNYLENHVVNVNIRTWDQIKKDSLKNQKHIFLLVSSRGSVSPLMKSISAVSHSF